MAHTAMAAAVLTVAAAATMLADSLEMEVVAETVEGAAAAAVLALVAEEKRQ